MTRVKKCVNCGQYIEIGKYEFYVDEDDFIYCDKLCFDKHMDYNNIPVEERPKGEYK